MRRTRAATLGALPGRGPDRLRPRAPTGGRRDRRVPREAGPTEIDTDEISAGAYVLERAVFELIPRDARSRSSGRCSRGSSATASTAAASRATGWTSGLLSVTSRPAGTSSSAGSRPSRAELDERRTSESRASQHRSRARGSGRRSASRRRASVAAGAESAPRACSAAACELGEAAASRDRSPRDCRIGAGARGARLDPRRGCDDRRGRGGCRRMRDR